METNIGVARFIADDPFNVLRMQTQETSFNLDGIWGGNMYADAAGAILQNKIASKHNIRYVPNMNGMDLVKKIRAQLDKTGYKDVGGDWPSYLFNHGKVGQKVSPVGMPIGGGSVGLGGRAHAANEFYVIEGAVVREPLSRGAARVLCLAA